jgi:serine/threonine protein kinase
MKELNHPNIVKYSEEFRSNFCWYSAPDFIVIIMEYCEVGNLLTYQAKLPGKTFPLKQAVKVIV